MATDPTTAAELRARGDATDQGVIIIRSGQRIAGDAEDAEVLAGAGREAAEDTGAETGPYPAGALYSAVTGYYSRQQGMTELESVMNQDLSGLANTQFFSRIARTLTWERALRSAREQDEPIEPFFANAPFEELTALI